MITSVFKEEESLNYHKAQSMDVHTWHISRLSYVRHKVEGELFVGGKASRKRGVSGAGGTECE